MAFSLNKVMLIGNLGNDSEHRFTTNNTAVSTFSIATSRSYKGRDGNWVNETTWHNVVAYSLPDFLKEALKKGKKFYVEGRISKRDYTDKDGIKRYVTEVISEKLIPLEGRETNGDSYDKSAVEPNVDSNTGEVDDLPF
ncbi:MAG: single-stranded DNA-binding protein [Ignavibacteria bacterium]|nr:single-stranded DNA-binding protein [Ignavibacteria bacterium]